MEDIARIGREGSKRLRSEKDVLVQDVEESRGRDFISLNREPER